jgi:DNA-binding response OmpR family regulator
MHTKPPLVEKRILVVEDNAILKIGLEVLLRDAGAQIVASLDHKLDAAVLDLRLEHGVTSVPFAQALSRRYVPFLFYTGLPAASLAGIRARFPDCLIIAKPSRPSEIVEGLVNLLERTYSRRRDRSVPAA